MTIPLLDTIEKAARPWDPSLHPRDLRGQFTEIVFGNENEIGYSDFVGVPDDLGDGSDTLADLQSINVEQGTATVNLHLEPDHPAVQDAVSMGHSEDVEQVRLVPLSQVRDWGTGNRLEPHARKAVAERKRRKAARARAQARREEEAENRRAHAAGEVPVGPRGMMLQELRPR